VVRRKVEPGPQLDEPGTLDPRGAAARTEPLARGASEGARVREPPEEPGAPSPEDLDLAEVLREPTRLEALGRLLEERVRLREEPDLEEHLRAVEQRDRHRREVLAEHGQQVLRGVLHRVERLGEPTRE